MGLGAGIKTTLGWVAGTADERRADTHIEHVHILLRFDTGTIARSSMTQYHINGKIAQYMGTRALGTISTPGMINHSAWLTLRECSGGSWSGDALHQYCSAKLALQLLGVPCRQCIHSLCFVNHLRINSVHPLSSRRWPSA